MTEVAKMAGGPDEGDEGDDGGVDSQAWKFQPQEQLSQPQMAGGADEGPPAWKFQPQEQLSKPQSPQPQQHFPQEAASASASESSRQKTARQYEEEYAQWKQKGEIAEEMERAQDANDGGGEEEVRFGGIALPRKKPSYEGEKRFGGASLHRTTNKNKESINPITGMPNNDSASDTRGSGWNDVVPKKQEGIFSNDAASTASGSGWDTYGSDNGAAASPPQTRQRQRGPPPPEDFIHRDNNVRGKDDELIHKLLQKDKEDAGGWSGANHDGGMESGFEDGQVEDSEWHHRSEMEEEDDETGGAALLRNNPQWDYNTFQKESEAVGRFSQQEQQGYDPVDARQNSRVVPKPQIVDGGFDYFPGI